MNLKDSFHTYGNPIESEGGGKKTRARQKVFCTQKRREKSKKLANILNRLLRLLKILYTF